MNVFEARLDTRILNRAVSQAEWIRFVSGQRWFAGKGREVVSARIVGCCPVDSALVVAVLEVDHGAGEPDLYQMPLLVGTDEESGAIAHLSGRPLLDALSFEEGWRRLLECFGRSRTQGTDLSLSTEIRGPVDRSGAFRLGSAEQTNSWALVGNLFVKVFRRFQPGENLDVETVRFLSGQGRTRTPVHRGSLSVDGDFGSGTLLSLQEAVPNQGTGWDLACAQVVQAVAEQAVDFEPWARLGRSMAELHAALASSDPDAPGVQPLHPPDLESVARGALGLAREMLAELASVDLPPAAEGLAQVLKLRSPALLRRIHAPKLPPGSCHRQRIHGDIHLGQVLWDGDDFTIIDFEGEPGRPVEERRRKHPPAKDLAGMLRSFDYAARAGQPAGTGQAGEILARRWRNEARKVFRTAYEAGIGGAPFLPEDPALRRQLIDLYEVEKAFYELRYELRHRPDWVEIPMAGLLDLVGTARR